MEGKNCIKVLTSFHFSLVAADGGLLMIKSHEFLTHEGTVGWLDWEGTKREEKVYWTKSGNETEEKKWN